MIEEIKNLILEGHSSIKINNITIMLPIRQKTGTFRQKEIYALEKARKLVNKFNLNNIKDGKSTQESTEEITD